jgi:molybdopterin-guanine dinucleotide biosynthesis protein A
LITGQPIHSGRMLSGVVLAGGQSKRLGREKALALLGGTALINHVVRTMNGLVDEILISVAKGRTADYGEAIADDVRIVEDSRAHVGPLEGLISTFGAAKGGYVLVAPCDTPLLKAEVCKVVLDEAFERDGAVPVINGYYEPLHGAYRREVGLMAFGSTLRNGKRRVSDAYSLMTLAEVDEATLRRIDPALESFWNMNTEKDLMEAEKRLGRGLR